MKRRHQTAGYDLVSAEAREKVDGWAQRSRELFTELLEDAPTDLQRELLNRAVAAGHSAAEVHAFADALRGFSDEETFDKCTIERSSAPDYSVVQLLKAEGDPLFAFRLKGGEISPAEDRPRFTDKIQAYSPPGGPGRERPTFDAKETGARKPTSQSYRDLGQSGAVQPRATRPPSGPVPVASAPRGARADLVPPPATGPVLLQDLLNEALGSLKVTFREQAVDGEGQPRLEELMPQAAQALQRGLPVPVTLGPAPGQDRRVALLVQAQISGKSRAYQLFDVVSQEIAWINEGDLLARAELPFASKLNRRITRIALPMSKTF